LSNGRAASQNADITGKENIRTTRHTFQTMTDLKIFIRISFVFSENSAFLSGFSVSLCESK
jgi:hypothetical protein